MYASLESARATKLIKRAFIVQMMVIMCIVQDFALIGLNRIVCNESIAYLFTQKFRLSFYYRIIGQYKKTRSNWFTCGQAIHNNLTSNSFIINQFHFII